MSRESEVVVTGIGVVSPIGIGLEPFWSALCEGRSGVDRITSFDASALPVQIAAEVRNFDGKEFVRPRKSLKVMSRDMQFAVAAAGMAQQHAGLSPENVDPDRVGVVMGTDSIRTSVDEMALGYRRAVVNGEFHYDIWAGECIWDGYPLGMLKNLPNMPACHISIAQDARGPNNTIQQAEASSLLAISEAAGVIERGVADVMLAGASSSRLHPLDWIKSCLSEQLSPGGEDPRRASRPFDAMRDGLVRGEGAAVFILESRRHAQARGARILARILGRASACEPRLNGTPVSGDGLRRAMAWALDRAALTPADVGHVNAHGLSTVDGDAGEARAIRELLGDVPVTALKSYFGNLYAAAGAVEMAASVLSLEQGLVPPTLNYQRPDQACPIQVVQDGPLSGTRPTCLLVNQTTIGQAAALLIASDD